MNCINYTAAFVTYRYNEGLVETVNSFFKFTPEEYLSNQIIIINNYDDGLDLHKFEIFELGWVREEVFDTYYENIDVRLINNYKNQGVARSWNQCIRFANNKNVLICNDDLKFEQGWFNKIVKLRNENDYEWIGHPSCYMFNKNLLKSVGYYDERFTEGGWEDDDYRIRMQQANVKFFEEKGLLAFNIKAGKIGTRPERYIFDNRNYNKFIFEKKWQKVGKVFIRNKGWKEEINWYPKDNI